MEDPIVRKILASLFVIAAVIGVGVFATGAYFTDTVTQTNLTFKTTQAQLMFGFCPGLQADCSSTAAGLHDLSTFPDAKIGPGITNADCLVIENTGDYALNLTGGISGYHVSATGMDNVFLVKAETTDSSCNPGSGTVIYSLQSLASASANTPQPFGPLAPGGRLYVIWSNAWDSSGNQNTFQNQTITVDTFMTGQTN
jgi:hypothetical protein